MRSLHLLPLLAATALAVCIGALAAPQDDPLELVKSDDPAVRADAARALAGVDDRRAETALVRLTRGDDDLLVRIAAAEALGASDSKAATKALVEVAVEARFTRERLAAARALAATGLEAAREALADELKGRDAVAAAGSMVAFERAALARGDAAPAEALEDAADRAARMLRSRDVAERTAGARALMVLTRAASEARLEAIEEVLVEGLEDGGGVEVACAALEGMAIAPAPDDEALLLGLLARDDLATVVTRRVEAALAAHLGALPSADLDAAVGRAASASGAGAARALGLAGDLDDAARVEALRGLLGADDVGARAAAAHALASVGEAGARAAADALAGAEDPRVLARLAESAVAPQREAPDAGIEAQLVAAAAAAEDPRAREALALALGRAGASEDAARVVAAWARDEGPAELRVTAAVALGATRREAAVPVLTDLAGTGDWRLRAAAAAGFERVSSRPCVAPLLSLLDDESATVALTAHRALLLLADREGEDVDPATWPAWWEENGQRVTFTTRAERQALDEAYGYGVDDALIYRGLDVVVVPGRGDHIEAVLERLGIVHRKVRAGELASAGLHPGAILLVGCTGEIAPEDVPVVRWFVRSGGALFTSCWALTYTVEPSFPAIVTRFPSPGEVLDDVFARPTAAAEDSAYLTGVFDGGVQPFYRLVGAHLIQVVDPERAEVLLDSPAAAARHGSGDLAAWFRVGHGVVLDTANHFEEQGFSAAPGLDGPEERQAFAVNHMGMSPERLRQVQDERWWRSQSKTAEEVADLSVFRILTNFVREKRIGR